MAFDTCGTPQAGNGVPGSSARHSPFKSSPGMQGRSAIRAIWRRTASRATGLKQAVRALFRRRCGESECSLYLPELPAGHAEIP